MAYVAGSGPDEPADFAGLCAFACEYNMCPNPCECLKTGKAKTPPASDGTVGTAQKITPGATRCASLPVAAVSALRTCARRAAAVVAETTTANPQAAATAVTPEPACLPGPDQREQSGLPRLPQPVGGCYGRQRRKHLLRLVRLVPREWRPVGHGPEQHRPRRRRVLQHHLPG